MKPYTLQCYVPLANWLLMIGCVIVVGVFNNTTSLGNAYGLCVILVTMVTTCLVSLVAIIVWRFNTFFVVLPIFLIFLTWDGLFLSISVFKIPDGAWVTVLIAGVLSAVMVIWRTGKSLQWKAEAKALERMTHEVNPMSTGYNRIEGAGIFFDEMDDDKIPPIYSYWLRSFQARHQILLFVHLRQTYHPTVTDEDRFTVAYVPGLPDAYRILLRFGYNEPRSAITASAGLLDAVRVFLDKQISNSRRETKQFQIASEQMKTWSEAIKAKDPVYMFGRKVIQNKYEHKNKSFSGAIKGMVVYAYSSIRDIMTSKPRLWELPPNSIVEIGKAVLI
jgi:KUP system potassium uptake protein